MRCEWTLRKITMMCPQWYFWTNFLVFSKWEKSHQVQLTDSWDEDEENIADQFFEKYKVPLKNGKNIETWALNWPYHLGDIFESGRPFGSRSLLMESFANATIFEDSYEKYENTKLFLDYLENNHPEYFS